MKKVVVVIPIYKEKLNDLEKISLAQVFDVLGAYDIYFVAPEGLDYDYRGDAKEKTFPKKFFESVSSYNEFMLCADFYEAFSEYEFMLIYQLDAFVFEDRLEEFCGLEYDYIGAPWLCGWFYYKDADHVVWNVGNGGFSLRKISAFVKALREDRVSKELRVFFENEDFNFSVMDCSDFKVAPKEIALKFSFESQVRECFEYNNRNLPMGCHAWEKYDLEFWKPYMESHGYKLENRYMKNGNADRVLKEEYQKRLCDNLGWQNICRGEVLKKELSERFPAAQEKYIVWGAGYLGCQICKLAEEKGIVIKSVIDGNEALWGKKMRGINIVSPDSIDHYEKEGVIIAIETKPHSVLELLEKKRAKYVHYAELFEKEPLISVITVCYNSVKTIERTIQSVLSQPYKKKEYIIIDGGSTDGTVDIIRKYEKEIDYWISEPDDGIYQAMNKGVHVAKGQLVGFLSSNDWYDEDVLTPVAQAYRKGHPDLIYGNITFCNGTQEVLKKYGNVTINDFAYGMPLPHPSCFVRTQLQKEYGFDESYRIAADYKFCAQICKDGCSLMPIDHNITFFTEGGISSRSRDTLDETYRVACEIFGEESPSCELARKMYCFQGLFLNAKDLWEQTNAEIRNQIRMKWKKPCYVFGTGDIGLQCLKLFQVFGLNVDGLLDNAKYRHGKKIQGVTVYSPETILQVENAIVVIASLKYGKEMKDQFIGKGMSDTINVYEVNRFLEQLIDSMR